MSRKLTCSAIQAADVKIKEWCVNEEESFKMHSYAYANMNTKSGSCSYVECGHSTHMGL